ncbi:MAG: DUF4136 domain-containing protein [Cyclobacteriaceae bacterium]
MKATTFFALVLLFLTSCFGYKELPVEYDYSYKGRFTKYKSYDLFDLPVIDGDSSMNNEVVERTIDWRMRLLGYKKTDHKPNILISYRMYYDSLKLKGYQQPDIESWALNKTNEKEIYNKENYQMQNGTLVIQLYDRKLKKSIWQGYATNQYGNISFENDRNLRNAVVSILDKYRFLAEGYLEEKVLQRDGPVEETLNRP